MPTDQYTECLLNTIKEIVAINIAIMILAMIFVFFLISSIRRQEKQSIWIHSIVLVISCFTIIGSMVYITPFAADIRDESYIKFEGKYFVESIDDTGVVGSVSYVRMGTEESKKYEFYPNPNYWEEGEYIGYIVYSKRSKVILEWGGEKITT